MRYRNNLTDKSQNAYLVVTEPFEVYALAGHSDSNTWVGSSKALGNVYDRVTLKPGDEIHDLFGGVFAVIDGTAREVRTTISEKHLFEKSYGGSVEEWPVAKLREIKAAEATQPKGGYRPKPLPSDLKPGKFVGRSLDSVRGS